MTGISVSLNLGFEDAQRAAENGGVEGLNDAVDRLIAISVPLTPIDLGDLRGGTQPTYATMATLEAAASNDMEYAARQHEELTWRHPKGGQAKFLEAPARDNATELMEIVGASIRRSLRS
ncbi:MAG TPA: hypothetical protein VF885_17330 [Arthrobacter sp.]